MIPKWEVRTWYSVLYSRTGYARFGFNFNFNLFYVLYVILFSLDTPARRFYM